MGRPLEYGIYICMGFCVGIVSCGLIAVFCSFEDKLPETRMDCLVDDSRKQEQFDLTLECFLSLPENIPEGGMARCSYIVNTMLCRHQVTVADDDYGVRWIPCTDAWSAEQKQACELRQKALK